MITMTSDYAETSTQKKEDAKKLMSKDQFTKCSVAIHTASAVSAAAGFLPIPVADALPISAAQITMVMTLGKIFHQEITKTVAESLIGAVAGTFVGRNLVKFIPGVGWAISVSVAAGVTEAIGWTIAVDFAHKYKSSKESEIGSGSELID